MVEPVDHAGAGEAVAKLVYQPGHDPQPAVVIAGWRGAAVTGDPTLVGAQANGDAMTTPRPYRALASHADALAELRKNAGTQFDPVVVEAFERIVEETLIAAAREGGRSSIATA